MHRIRIGLIALIGLAIMMGAIIPPAMATTTTYTITPPGDKGASSAGYQLFYNPIVGGIPNTYTVPNAGIVVASWYYWLHYATGDKTAKINLSSGGKNYTTVKITLTDLGYDSYFNDSWGPNGIGRAASLKFEFLNVDPAITSATGPWTTYNPPLEGDYGLYDNISYYYSGGWEPQALIWYDNVNKTPDLLSNLGLTFSYAGPFGEIFAKNGLHIYTSGTGAPPIGGGCNQTIQILNIVTGNLIAGSTLSLKDDSLGGWSTYSLPTGQISIGMNLSDSYTAIGHAIGYNDTTAGFSFAPWASCDGTLPIRLHPSPETTTNASVTFYVHEDGTNCNTLGIPTACPVAGALVHISGASNEYKNTNDFGSASFVTPLTGILNYSVTKDNYLGVDGAYVLTGDLLNTVDVTMHRGAAFPTLNVPEADTSPDALQLVLNNAYGIAAFLLFLFFWGGIKMAFFKK